VANEALTAEIITIGNEILSGLTVNTNASAISLGLESSGVPVRRSITVGDDAADLEEAFLAARESVIVVTGGLGPTHDDITRSVFCDVFGMGLRQDADVLEHLNRLFEARGRELTERNIDQANVPDRATALMNPIGTAPGIHFEGSGRHWFLLPGVPREMAGLLRDEVLPRLAAVSGGSGTVRRDLHVVGLPESNLMDLIDGIDGLESVASLPDARGEVNLRITVRSVTDRDSWSELDRIERALRERLGANIFGTDDDTLEAVVGESLRERGMTLALAESCTGGLVASRITDVPGSSEYFVSSIVAYANAAKVEYLDVPTDLITDHGAVSCEVARAMAVGARNRSCADVALSLTGVAGPGGGTPDKPAGLVVIALAHADGVDASEFRFGSERALNKARASQAALDMLRRHLLTL
jgi:nicotinamide-nucleotide amidase